MDVADNTDWLFDLNQVRLRGEHLKRCHEDPHNLWLGEGSLPGEEILQNSPVGHVIVSPKCLVFDRLIDHARTLLIR